VQCGTSRNAHFLVNQGYGTEKNDPTKEIIDIDTTRGEKISISALRPVCCNQSCNCDHHTKAAKLNRGGPYAANLRPVSSGRNQDFGKMDAESLTRMFLSLSLEDKERVSCFINDNCDLSSFFNTKHGEEEKTETYVNHSCRCMRV